MAWSIDHFDWLADRRLRIAGWAFGEGGSLTIAIILNGRRVATLAHGLVREDVGTAHLGQAGALRSGFDGEVELGASGTDIEMLEIVALAGGTAQTCLLRKSWRTAVYRTRWSTLLNERGLRADDVFHVPVATSRVAHGGADGIRDAFAVAESRTVKLGIRVQILYLRTTLGAAADYVFDPDFVADKRVEGRLVAEDSLNDVIRFAMAERMPVLFTLNGGIWSDAACESVEWDINDALERDEAQCQWNEHDQVMPDGALAGLPGSMESPQLGRCLSLNVYMDKVRFYKKRNLQHAATLIARFATEHPDLFIGVNLDPDVYVNPFFEGAQWYDYNPATLRQFRHWLRADGPYAGAGGAGVPDLSRYRRATGLTLAQVGRLAHRRHATWDEVDPPRRFSFGTRPFWRSPWVALWKQFRRHLVHLHYDELSQWVAECGISPARIHSSQGFMAPGPWIDPLPVRLDSPAKNYDTGGMSIEGSVPSHGRLGAIVYGDSACNQIRMERQSTLFAEFRTFSPDWAVVEYNVGDLTRAEHLAPYGQAYGSLRDMANYGARFVSPMAWNGSPGDALGQPGFRGYTALRRSPLEEAIVHFMWARADLPRQARLWTFGATTYPDTDGWHAEGGRLIAEQPSRLLLQLGGQGAAALVSPPELAWKASDCESLIIQAQVPDAGLTLALQGLTESGAWHTLFEPRPWHRCTPCDAGRRIAMPARTPDWPVFQRIRLLWRGAPGAQVRLGTIALYPR